MFSIQSGFGKLFDWNQLVNMVHYLRIMHFVRTYIELRVCEHIRTSPRIPGYQAPHTSRHNRSNPSEFVGLEVK